MKTKLFNILALPIVTTSLPLTAISFSSCSANPQTPEFAQDSDWDGLPDSEDEEPNNNVVTYRYRNTLSLSFHKVEEYSKEDTFTMDYRYFVDEDSHAYNKKIAKILVPLSNMYIFTQSQYKNLKGEFIYDGTYDSFLKRIGLQDIVSDEMYDTEYETDENDIGRTAFGHHDFLYNGKKYQVFIISLCGTSTPKEWASNFDIGINKTPYTEDVQKEHPEWTNYNNHKGFDVCANRTYALAQKYISSHQQTGFEKPIIAIAGHSRGASTANILGKLFEDAGYKNFTYTFAPANITFNLSSETKKKYSNIYNLCNGTDFVTKAASPKVGFDKYGVDCNANISEYRQQFVDFVPYWESTEFNDVSGLEKPIVEILSGSQEGGNRDNMYDFTSPAAKKYNEPHYSDEAVARVNHDKVVSTFESHPNLKKFVQVSDVYKVQDEEKYTFDVNLSAGFIIEFVMNVLTHPISILSFIKYAFKWSSQGEDFFINLAKIGPNNILHNHMLETYTVLINNDAFTFNK